MTKKPEILLPGSALSIGSQLVEIAQTGLHKQPRTEFGQERSVCACDACKINCRFMPGYLLPSDLGRMIPEGADPYAWAKTNLLASPGATVMFGDRSIQRVPTLVPAVKEDGSCIHLSLEGRCTVHEIAPFGCAFFDCKTPYGDHAGNEGIKAVMQAWNEDHLYAKLWRYLDTHGKRQKEPALLRERMRKALAR